MRRWVIGVLGIWRGESLGKGSGQGRSVYKQPCIVYIEICNCVQMECLKRLNDASCVHTYMIIIIGMNVVNNLNSV